MKATPLETNNPSVHLVEPELERDSQLGVEWLHGDIGRNTLQLMGVSDNDNNATTLEQEKQRVTDFIERPDQLNWMIEYQGQVVGSIWIDLEPKDRVPSPAIHIMIGDPRVRGKSVGLSSTSKVVEYLEKQGNKSIYSRHLKKNDGARSLLDSLGFKDMGEPYTDEDGLEWQNVEKTARRMILTGVNSKLV
jgi:hypothetical protein